MTAAGEVTLRRGLQEDWPGVQALLREIDELHAGLAPTFFRSAPRAELEWRRLLGDAHGAAIVAAEGPAAPAVLGLVAVRVYDTPPEPLMHPRRRGHVETLVVAAPHRRRGIGSRLLAAASEWARARGATEMVLTAWSGNDDADAFYERHGYRVLSRVLYAAL
ncbi:MAG TPA: GNAT family N-acetyltransferase [Polyangia bacterium]|nr:GNAT family N-acetyltransferase [Polyangia bacterium]